MEDIEKEATGGRAAQDVRQPSDPPGGAVAAQAPAVPAAEAAAPAPPAGAGKATAALALGIAAIVLCPSAVLGIGLGVAAVLAAGSYRKAFGKDGGGDSKAGRAKAGRVCGFVGIGLGALWGVVWAALVAFGVWAVTTTSPGAVYESHYDDPAAAQGPGVAEPGDPDPDDDVIIAGGVDSSSKYAFEVDTAVVGLDEYSEVPVVVLVGEFTNESDETVSFSDALDAVATQDGWELDSAYLQGADAFNYESIAPGKTVPAFIGWELWDGESDVEIAVYDQYHYAKQVVFEGAFTIDELLANTEALSSELEGILDEEQELAA